MTNISQDAISDDGRDPEDAEIIDQLTEELEEVIGGEMIKHGLPALAWVFSMVVVRACDHDPEKVRAMFAGYGKAASEYMDTFAGRTLH